MRFLSDARHFRRTVTGLAMIGGPLAFLAGTIVGPDTATDNEGQILSAVAGAPDRYFISVLCFFVGATLLVVAILGLMHMLRERSTALSHLGGGLAFVGMMGIVFAFGGSSLMTWQMVKGGADRGQMVALLQRFYDSDGLVAFLVLSILFSVGLVVFAVAMWRARVVAPWSAILVAASGVLFVFAFSSITLQIVTSAVLLVGLGSIGWMLLTEADADWDHQPEFHGFRPAAGTQ